MNFRTFLAGTLLALLISATSFAVRVQVFRYGAHLSGAFDSRFCDKWPCRVRVDMNEIPQESAFGMALIYYRRMQPGYFSISDWRGETDLFFDGREIRDRGTYPDSGQPPRLYFAERQSRAFDIQVGQRRQFIQLKDCWFIRDPQRAAKTGVKCAEGERSIRRQAE